MEYYIFNIVGCPIRKSTDQFVFANPRSLSQLITSFFASESLGILHAPLFTFFCYAFCTHIVRYLRNLILLQYTHVVAISCLSQYVKELDF
jgi:hypothetical protein